MGLAPGLLAGLYMLVSVLTQPRPIVNTRWFVWLEILVAHCRTALTQVNRSSIRISNP